MPERDLHNQLKEWIRRPGDLVEAQVWGYKADIIRGNQLIEVQTGNFAGDFRKKLRRLIKGYNVHVAYPIPEKKWLIKEKDGKRSRRLSSHKGRVEEVFNELIYIPTLPLQKGFSLDVLLIHSEENQEIKWRGRKRDRYGVTSRRLLKVVGSVSFTHPSDYLRLLPSMKGAFTARQLSRESGLRITLARRMVYCLSKMGLIEEVGTVAKAKLYRVKNGSPSSS